MACQLTLLSTFQDIGAVKTYLFPKLKTHEAAEPEPDPSDGWDDADWGWKDEDEEKAEAQANKKEDALEWLQECHISVSPTCDFIALANEERLVLLAQKWDPGEKSEIPGYSVVFEDSLGEEESLHEVVRYKSNKLRYNTREQITSILCLPLASQKRSTHGGPDWTCIIVGFNSGYVRMYTENGTLLLSQIFSEEPVVTIKCRTYEPPRHVADAEKHEELTILYRKALVTIDGFSFFQSLRACRNQVARAAASGGELIQPPPLAYKKWALQEQNQITDHIMCGMSTPNPFDQMQTASMLGGYSATIRPTPPASHLYVTAGMGPYVGFFYAMEGSTQPVLSDVAHAVASKLKSALFSQISAASGWFGLGGRQTQDNHKEKKKPKIEPATSLPARFGLRDKRRQGESIVVCPDNKLAATTDSFGRVMLIDINRGVAVRIWKGYRDAQVGWIEVREDIHPDRERGHTPSEPRRALFMVIYAPRRGILEVWTAQQGPRVAAFNVSKYCRLFCPGYSMMGLNNVTCRDVRVHLHQCYLIDPDSGIKTVDVPFHLVLSDKNSKRARDLHLLKRLKLSLKETTVESGALQTEVIDTLLDMRVGSIKQQGLERVLHTKYMSAGFLQAVLKAVAQQLDLQGKEAMESEEGGNLDFESRMLLQFCRAEERLVEMYICLDKLNSRPPPFNAVVNKGDVHEEVLARCLGLTLEEAQSLFAQTDNYHNTVDGERWVSFDSEPQMAVTDFLSCFECHLAREDKTAEGSIGGEKGSISLQIHVKPTIPEARYIRLGNLMFQKRLVVGVDAGAFDMILHQSPMPPEDLLMLLLQVWLSEDKRKLDLVPNLHELLKLVSQLKDPLEVTVDHNKLSPWWEKMRIESSQSENIATTLMCAHIGRAVAMELSANSPKCKPSPSRSHPSSQMESSSESANVNWAEWESVTMDRTQWTVLVKQLEDLLALQCLIKMKPTNKEAGSLTTLGVEPIRVSVKKVLDGGRGVLPELVARWIAGQAIAPETLCLQEEEDNKGGDKGEKGEEERVEAGEEITEHTKKHEPQNPIISQLQVIQKRLPHSLDSDILMANCAWEYVMQWNKDIEMMFPLQQALAYLKCIQNAVLTHGVASMMWQMFMVKRVSAAAFLTEKVGKAPKERLCRRDVGMSEVALEIFMGVAVELLDTLMQSSRDSHEVPVFNVEDLWAGVQGPTSLAELAVEQKETNFELVEHHFHLCGILLAILTFKKKNAKPFSLFDTKGRNAFFKPLHATPILPSRIVDDAVQLARKQLLSRVITQAVLTLGDKSASPATSSASSLPDTPATSPTSDTPTSPASPSHCHKGALYSKWPPLVLRLAKDLGLEVDLLRRHHVCELYSSGLDKMAEEILLSVNDHYVMGSQLILIAGQRLAHFIFLGDPLGSVGKIANCPPTVSTWLKSLDISQLRVANTPLRDTAALIGQVVNQLPESHTEYNTAISLVELIQSLQ